MSMTILATKLYAPPPPPSYISRPDLLARFDAGIYRKLSVVCAPAGFGKSTLVSEWLTASQYPSAWLSLESGDSEIVIFLNYIVAALQTISDTVGAGVARLLDATPAPTAESVITVLLNNLSTTKSKLILVLDDYHLVASEEVDKATAFLIENLPPQLHLVITTREEPKLSIARLRVQGQLTELRQEDLRFSARETADFLNVSMGLGLSEANIAALDTRTEGWIAGLQLVAISLQGTKDASAFISSFSGSHTFIQDYLLEEVLRQQSESMLSFLLATSVLDRMCGPLCDAVLLSNQGQTKLNYLVQNNLFVVPLDNQRRWYRYHHLFSELLRQRLSESQQASTYHIRASIWYEENGLEIDAFHQAVAAADVPRAARLIEGNGKPLYFRGEMLPIINWLQSLPQHALDACPSLWVKFAWSLLLSGQFSRIDSKLRGAEASLVESSSEGDEKDLLGQIAALSAWQAVYQSDVANIYAHATRSLELLNSNNHPARTAAKCALGVAFLYKNEKVAASESFAEVIAMGHSSGNIMFTVVASIASAGIHAANNRLQLAAAMYRDVIAMITDPSQVVGREAHLGLAKILYEWNELETAETHALQCSKLASKEERYVGSGDALLAKLKLARNEDESADQILMQASITAQVKSASTPMPEIASVQILAMLRRGEVGSAAQLAIKQQLPLAQARATLAQGQHSEALSIVITYRTSMEQQELTSEVLNAAVLQAVILFSIDKVQAIQVLYEALQMAESGGFIRMFIDEGPVMETLLSMPEVQKLLPGYVAKLRSAFAQMKNEPMTGGAAARKLAGLPTSSIESYSPRELEILRLIHEGRSNQQIGEQLFLSLSTVKWHNQNIFSKLQVQRRTEAVARALELNLVTR